MSQFRVVRVRPSRIPWVIGLLAAAAIVAFWPDQHPARPDFRALCEAQGGLVVRLEAGGRLCLWAGAVIPLAP